MLTKCLLAVILLVQASWAYSLQPRVTGGVDAEKGEFPYQVSVAWRLLNIFPLKHICGGSIVNEKWVLTAAHCVIRMGKMKVVAGKYKSEIAGTEQIINVVQKIVHENYKNPSLIGGINPHDIALLKLETPLVFNSEVSAVHLPKVDEVHTGYAVLTGWGSISNGYLPKFPEVLQKVSLPLLDNPTCLKQLRAVKAIGSSRIRIFESQVCTGTDNKEVSACSGDSGGPLVQFDDGVPYQVGVVSFGAYPCGSSKAPSVYTRVAYYVDWINQKINVETV